MLDAFAVPSSAAFLLPLAAAELPALEPARSDPENFGLPLCGLLNEVDMFENFCEALDNS